MADRTEFREGNSVREAESHEGCGKDWFAKNSLISEVSLNQLAQSE